MNTLFEIDKSRLYRTSRGGEGRVVLESSQIFLGNSSFAVTAGKDGVRGNVRIVYFTRRKDLWISFSSNLKVPMESVSLT